MNPSVRISPRPDIFRSILALLTSVTLHALTPLRGATTDESSYDEIDPRGGPAIAFDINTASGGTFGVGVYRDKHSPGQYWVVSAPLPLKPETLRTGYPSLVFSGWAPGNLEVNGSPSSTYRVKLGFQLYTKELLKRAKEEVLKSATEKAYLEASNIDSAIVGIKPLPISSVVIEVQYAGSTFSTARTPSTVNQSDFFLYFDLTEEQLRILATGIEDGELSFMAHLRSRGAGNGWAWGEMHSRLTTELAQREIMDLKKTAERRGMKDLVFIGDVASAGRNFAAQATTVIRTNDRTLVGTLQPDDFASVVAESIRLVSIDDLRHDYPGVDEVIEAYLLPLIEQQLESRGHTDVKTDLKRQVREETANAGGGFALPFIGGDASSTTTKSVIEGVERTAGVKFQKDALKKRFVLTDVSVRKVREAVSFTQVRLNKTVIIEGGVGNYWLTQPPISVVFKADDVKAALGVQSVAKQLQLMVQAARTDAQRRVAVAKQRVEDATGRFASAANVLDQANAELKAVQKAHAEATVELSRSEQAHTSAEKMKVRRIMKSSGKGEGRDYWEVDDPADARKKTEAISIAAHAVSTARGRLYKSKSEMPLAELRVKAAMQEHTRAAADLSDARAHTSLAEDALKGTDALVFTSP